MRNVSEKSCRGNQNTQFVSNDFFFFFRLWDNVEKYGRAGQATDDNMAHDQYGYKRRSLIAVYVDKADVTLW